MPYFQKSTKSRNSGSSVSCGTNSNWDFAWVWMCTEAFWVFQFGGFRGWSIFSGTCHISSSDEHFQWKVSYQLIGEIGCVLGCVREIDCVRSLLIVATTYRRDRKVSYQLIGEIGCVFLRYGVGWLRLVGSCKLQVSFAECSLFYRALLQKRPIILRSLLIVGTPYHSLSPLSWERNAY